MIRFLSRSRLSLLCVAVGFGALLLSGRLIADQVAMVRDVREASVPLLAELATLERTAATLRQQVEVGQVQASLKTGSKLEYIEANILPAEYRLDQLIAFFDMLQFLTAQSAEAEAVSVSFGEEVETPYTSVSALPLELALQIPHESLSDVLLLLRMTGTLTVADVLSEEDLDRLLARTEAENPAGIVALEQFLSSDVLQYAMEPRAAEQALLKSFPSAAFRNDFAAFRSTSGLDNVETLLGKGVGAALDAQQLWPLPFMTVENLSLTAAENDTWHMTIQLYVYRRSLEKAR